jgi:hypothetical protein
MSESAPDWAIGFPAAVTVSGADGTILYMNDKAARTFAGSGGRALVGSGLMDCHKEASRTAIRRMMDEERPNAYTIEKGGLRKMIYQAPWYRDGEVAGLVEISMEIPDALPHFVRD